MRAVGIYIHYPWCLAKCPYCDFVSYADPSAGARTEDRDHAYADAVLREAAVRAPVVQGRRPQSVFFGGGTPSLWAARALARVIRGLETELGGAGALEITVECNPSTLDEDKARALLDAGVNRLSIGVQSLRDERLRFLGRLHDAAGALAAIRSALRAGFRRVSADLIFGLPGQSSADAQAEASELADLGLLHVSSYQLTIEPGTRFGELARRGRLPLAEDGAVADAFLAIDEVLTRRGLEHYEVSNYAVRGEESRHNLGYWRGDEYLGLGCGAYGFVRLRSAAAGAPALGIRWRNPRRPEVYVEATRSHDLAILRDKERDVEAVGPGGSGGAADRERGAASAIADLTEDLDAETLLRERIMLGLRVRGGIDLDEAGQDLGVPGWTPGRQQAAAWLEARGRIARSGAERATIHIPSAAWLWTDDTAARLL